MNFQKLHKRATVLSFFFLSKEEFQSLQLGKEKLKTPGRKTIIKHFTADEVTLCVKYSNKYIKIGQKM